MTLRARTRTDWPLVSAAQMRSLDDFTIESLGVPSDVLMESAGRAVAEQALAQRAPGDSVVCVCGTGNNGGDGFVAARHLHGLSVPTRIVWVGDRDRCTPEAQTNAARAEAVGLAIEPESALAELPTQGVVIDAIFGTGLARDLEGTLADVVQRLAAARTASGGALVVVSVDVPSGLCADTGRARGVAVAADVTVTLGLPKLGLAIEPGRALAGQVVVARIGIAEAAPGTRTSASLWTRAGARKHLPPRPPAGHKGSFGHALLIAGSEGMTGAAELAAAGALRAGTGLVTLGCPARTHSILATKCTEAMTAPLSDTAQGTLAADARAAVLALLEGRDAVGLGPGLGREPETGELVRALCVEIELPLALDADGLVAFAAELEELRVCAGPRVLTPHPGEAATLLGISVVEVNRDRPEAARELARRSGATVLLKGAASITAEPGGRIVVNPTGGPALAAGGTGDVLLGVVTGFLAQGVAPFEAAALAAFVHGAAGDRWTQRHGESGLLAREVAAEVPDTMGALRAGVPESETGFVAAFPGA